MRIRLVLMNSIPPDPNTFFIGGTEEDSVAMIDDDLLLYQEY